MSAEEKARQAATSASDGKAVNIVILDVREVSTVTDFFVICTGTGQNHLRSIGDRIEEDLKKAGAKPLHVDGYKSSGWIVFDYGNVIIHAMSEEVRLTYDLERLWGDAPRLQVDEI